jgi:hypothetical protein
MAAGGLAVVLAVIGVVQFGPKKGTSAAPPAQIVGTPASGAPERSAPMQQAAPMQPAPAPSAAPEPSAPSRARGSVSQAPVRQQPAAHAPVQQQAAPPVPQTSVPQQQTSAAQNTPPSAPAQPQRPAIDPAKAAELQKVREDLVMLQTRASSVRTGLDNLRRQQAASGLGLRADMQQASSLMGSFLEGAVNALNAGDAAAARGFMEKAERNVERVENFLGR